MTIRSSRVVQGWVSWTAAVILGVSFFVPSSAGAESRQASSQFRKSAGLFLQRCSKCHTIGGGRRVGPDLRGVAGRHDQEWILGFIEDPESYLAKDAEAKRLLAENNGVHMENTHVTRAEAEGLLDFIKQASIGPSMESPAEVRPPEEPLVLKLRMPDEGVAGLSVRALILAGLLSIAALLLLRFRQRRDAALLAILAAAAAYWGFGGWRHHLILGNQQGYEPSQPIAFSHKLHAGDLTISCLYCHSGAERSDIAGVPPRGVCMNCHVAVRTQAVPSSVQWTRVHHLPDYVHFSHRAHVANNIQCQECHGPVQTMVRLRQAASLSMGWCIQCHRTPPESSPSHWKWVGGPLDCAACHW